jgi:preprotein translocase subunit YajC
MGTLIVIVLLLGLLWVFIVLPSRRRQRSHAEMQDSVDVGDEIITAGGLHGTVREVEDDRVRLEIAPDIVVTLDRRAVAAVATEVEVEVEDELYEGDESDVEEPLEDPDPGDDGPPAGKRAEAR